MTQIKTKSNATFRKLAAGRSDDEIADLCGVHRTTVARWRSGSPIPLTALRLLQLYYGGEFPPAFGEFAGFRIVDGRYLVAPGQHWQNAVSAEHARQWFFIEQRIRFTEGLQHENARLRTELAESRRLLTAEFESRLRQMVGALMTLAYPGIDMKEKQ